MADYAIYARQSLDREGAGLAITRQVEDCRTLARRVGLTGEPAVYSDNDMSATRIARRPGYQDLLDALRAGRHDTLVVWHGDRLHRRPVELEEFIDIAEATQLTVHAVQTGDLDLSTPSGRMVARIVGAVARHEVEHKSARRRRANLQRAQRGVHFGSTRGFGYGRSVVVDGVRHDRDHLRINRREAAAIRDAAGRMCAGEPTSSIWRSWNAAGLRTPKGHLWQQSTFGYSMKRPALAGLVKYRGAVLDGARSKAPAILPFEQWRQVQAIFAQPGRRPAGLQPVRGLLDRVVTCGACGEPMRLQLNRGRRQQDGTRRQFPAYTCPTHPRRGHCAIVATRLDPIVEDAVAILLARRRRAARPADADQSAATAHRLELAGVDNREARLLEAIAAGLITLDLAARNLRAIGKDRARLLDAITAVESGQPATNSDPQAVADRFLHNLETASVAHWPEWFATAHPELATAMLRHQIRDVFSQQPLLVRQAIVRSTVRVVVSPTGAAASRILVAPA